MALDIHDPKYGYNYPSTAVYVPTPVVSMITATQGDTVYALGYHVDSGSPENIDIPSALQFGFILPQTIQNGSRTLTILAYDGNFDLYSETFNFTVAGQTQYKVKTPTDPNQVKTNEKVDRTPKHTADIQERRREPSQRTDPPEHIAQTITINIIPPAEAPDLMKPRVLVEALFKEEKQPDEEEPLTRSLGSFRFPNQLGPTVFKLFHPEKRGQVIIRVYLWEPSTILKDDKMKDIVKKCDDLTFDHVP